MVVPSIPVLVCSYRPRDCRVLWSVACMGITVKDGYRPGRSSVDPPLERDPLEREPLDGGSEPTVYYVRKTKPFVFFLHVKINRVYHMF